MDMVTLTPGERSYALELSYDEESASGTTISVFQAGQKIDTKLFASRRMIRIPEPSSPNVEPFPRSILIQDLTVDWQDQRAQPRIFFEENGMIGFAPEGTQIGDLTCQFKDSDVAFRS